MQAGNSCLFLHLEADMAELELTPEQEAEAQRLTEIIAKKAKGEALRIACLLVSKADHELLGATDLGCGRQRLVAHGAACRMPGRAPTWPAFDGTSESVLELCANRTERDAAPHHRTDLRRLHPDRSYC